MGNIEVVVRARPHERPCNCWLRQLIICHYPVRVCCFYPRPIPGPQLQVKSADLMDWKKSNRTQKLQDLKGFVTQLIFETTLSIQEFSVFEMGTT